MRRSLRLLPSGFCGLRRDLMALLLRHRLEAALAADLPAVTTDGSHMLRRYRGTPFGLWGFWWRNLAGGDCNCPSGMLIRVARAVTLSNHVSYHATGGMLKRACG